MKKETQKAAKRVAKKATKKVTKKRPKAAAPKVMEGKLTINAAEGDLLIRSLTFHEEAIKLQNVAADKIEGAAKTKVDLALLVQKVRASYN